MDIKNFIPDLEEIAEDLGVPGIAAIVLLPVLVPIAAGKVGKPLAKSTIKGGILLYQKSKGVIAEVGETLEDIVAEAKAELAEAEAEKLAEAEAEKLVEAEAAS